ncbi:MULTISPECIES: type-F conjugative transfer system protein TraW [Burkholderiaceae]|uniref:type-F conjugative transfer system protein TraW n=1 Tax=Burkholderiaceae TaxID=119060 RepID=UPI000966B02F|nr:MULTISPECIES: type-F conjugative transfer system protein TraW [Burkholderiaceae]MCG1040529.1 type-F conjugative transfer system protein TraW [Mycetohabitans sp. B7]SIT64945.1 conjugal transfer pilus assembly protein TraW [Burkholderia sp. b14]
MRFSKLIAAWLAAAMLPAANAVHLGSIGQTYPIGEESALDMMMKKLRQKERTGELKKLQEQAIQRSIDSVKHMKPVDGITTVTERAQRLIDPTVIYAKAVTTDDGRIVIPAGTRINPLDVINLTKTLVFFDGRDTAQCEAVRKLVAQGSARLKPILVAGSWLDLTRAWKTQVFYDQHGSLTQRFGIKAVPSVIRQQGKMLLVEEIPAKELQ